MVQHGFYFDQNRCIGCNACSVGCKQWNHLPPGPLKWIRVYQWEKGAFPETRVHVLAISCYHCEKAVCIDACPRGALYKEPKYGAVLIHKERCTGLRKCWEACPYGSISFASDDRKEIASKCTMCIDRLEEGKKPLCVMSCSMRALEFGPVEELTSRFGNLRDLKDLPPSEITRPSVIFKAREEKRPLVPWDMQKALALWKKRGGGVRADLADIFDDAEKIVKIPPGMVGRDGLVLKPRNVEELMYYTTDND